MRAWYSILGCYRSTLFDIYYSRPHSLDGYTILNKFRENLKIAKGVAAQRGSKIMMNVPLPTFSLSKYIPYQTIYKRVIEETEEDRLEDRRNGMRLPREDGFRTEHRVKKRPATRKNISKQKRQILIYNAMKRTVPNHFGGAKEINLAEILRGKENPLQPISQTN